MPTTMEPLQVYLRVVALLKKGWRLGANPAISKGAEVEKCSRLMPHDYAASIMQGIDLVLNGTRGGVMHDLQHLFDEYSVKLAACSNKEDSQNGRLQALAWLLRNLAFLHPLGDKNGRSRLCLLQYELRRLGIGRGTFMYNNNKDIYFEPVAVYVLKLREGISMYKRAATTKSNPWADVTQQKLHQEKYKRSFDDALEDCWGTFCNPHNAGCKGTSLSLIQAGETPAIQR
eukprot:TRINITY_DN10480_c0_g3_i1.p1 TRINITY_DN10480_c0_g3~~TRINITY_DN10480_c0_g3_i1.p1  ORF type:complete len:230 (-),score=49.82 TRINITY_DN10480_c0_g3_i1:174-863(-)